MRTMDSAVSQGHGVSAGEALPPELEQRLKEVQAAADQEPGFVGRDWVILLLTGIVGPVILLLWGWPS